MNLKMLLPLVGVVARFLAPHVLDWIGANKTIPAWLKPVVTEVLTGLVGALTAGVAVKVGASRGAKIRAGVRKAAS